MRPGLLIACVGVVACGSSSTEAPDPALSDLAVSDLAPYSCPALDADGGALSDCQFFACKPTLADARTCQCSGPAFESPTAAVCGPYLKLLITNVDVAFDCYYDEATSTLVAVIGYGYDYTVACEGGPATFTPPSCQPRFAFCTAG